MLFAQAQNPFINARELTQPTIMNSETTKQNSKQSTAQTEEKATDFNGAALIDENGNEIPITEDMVQDACQTLAEEKVLKDK